MVTVATSQNAFRKQSLVAFDSPKEVLCGNSYGMNGSRSYWGPPVDLWGPCQTCSIRDGSFSKKVKISSGFNVIRPISSSFQRQLRPKIKTHDHGLCLQDVVALMFSCWAQLALWFGFQQSKGTNHQLTVFLYTTLSLPFLFSWTHRSPKKP